MLLPPPLSLSLPILTLLQVTLTNTPDLSSALNLIVLRLHLVMVEQIEDSASLYGCSISGHHICFLIKAQVRV